MVPEIMALQMDKRTDRQTDKPKIIGSSHNAGVQKTYKNYFIERFAATQAMYYLKH